jgi:hypothetical protein
MRWSILALATIAMACSRKGGNADSALLGDTALPPAVAADSTTPSQPPATSNPSTSQPGSGTPSTGTQRPSPSEPPNDVRPSIPREGRIAPAGGQRDSARGIPGVEGSERFTRVSLETPSGGTVRLSGDQAAAVGRLSGLDVWVGGTRDEKGVLMVERFAVRGADGRPARDGILVQSGNDYFLRLADGSRFDIPNPPAALREHVNDRVWVSGPAGSPPISFGVIERRQ